MNRPAIPLMSMTKDGKVWDDTKGGWLDAKMIKQARKDEAKFVLG